MAHIYQRGKIWYIDLRVKGRRVRKRIGTSKKIAELALKDAVVKAERDEFGFTRLDIDINVFFDRFLEYSTANHQPRTTARYRAVLEHFRTFLAKDTKVSALSQITPEVIDRYKVYRKTAWVNPNGQPVEDDSQVSEHTRRGARAHTINFEVGTLKTVLNVAIKWGYLRKNPTVGIKKLKVTDSKAPRFLTVDECRRLLDACPPDLHPIYYTFLSTGMRKAELEHLEWTDVDFKRRKILIRGKADWLPKTGEREIPLSDPMLSLFRELKKRTDAGLRSRFVFPHTDGGKIRTKLREKLIQIAEKAGIEDLTRVHTLRHTFASQLVMKGVDLPTVKKLMGHADIQTTMIYAHLAPDHLSEAVNKLDFSSQ